MLVTEPKAVQLALDVAEREKRPKLSLPCKARTFAVPLFHKWGHTGLYKQSRTPALVRTLSWISSRVMSAQKQINSPRLTGRHLPFK